MVCIHEELRDFGYAADFTRPVKFVPIMPHIRYPYDQLQEIRFLTRELGVGSR
jgi:hypothetical protein